MLTFGEVTKCNNCFDNYNNYINFCEENFLRKNFFVTFLFFCNFDPISHKFMSQKALTVYVDTIINLGKTAKRRKFAKINIRKKCLKHNSLHC